MKQNYVPAEVGKCCLPTAEVRFQPETFLCGICGGQGCAAMCFLLVLRFRSVWITFHKLFILFHAVATDTAIYKWTFSIRCPSLCVPWDWKLRITSLWTQRRHKDSAALWGRSRFILQTPWGLCVTPRDQVTVIGTGSDVSTRPVIVPRAICEQAM